MVESISEGARIARGTFWLTMGNLIGTGISAFATILIARFLGPSNYGIYSAALALLAIFAAADLGINRAATYYISKKRGIGEDYYRYIIVSLGGALLSGIVFLGIISLLAPQIAEIIFQKSYLAPLFYVVAIIVFSTAITRVAQGILLGLEKFEFMAMISIFSSIIRNIFAILFILMGLQAFGAITGQGIGYFSAMILAVSLVFFSTRRIRRENNELLLSETLRELYSYSLPLAMTIFATAIFQQFYNILAARSLSDFVYGNFSAAWLVFGATLMFPTALASALFPSLSKLASKDKTVVSSSFSIATKYASLILLPIAIVFIGVPDELIMFFYGPEYYMAGYFLRILSTVLLLCVIGFGVINPALLSLQRTKTIAIISLIAIVVSYAFITIFIGSISALSLIIGIIIMYALTVILGFIILWHDYGVTIEVSSSVKLLVAAIAGLAVIYFVKNLFSNILLSMGISAIMGISIYLALASILGSLNEKDYGNLRTYSRGIPILAPILLLAINIMEKTYRLIRDQLS
ncbi:MAG: oligosaccharide flippase family protein [Candidatus Njordarchaeales archaeon]